MTQQIDLLHGILHFIPPILSNILLMYSKKILTSNNLFSKMHEIILPFFINLRNMAN
jgi:hypothetical protein